MGYACKLGNAGGDTLGDLKTKATYTEADMLKILNNGWYYRIFVGSEVQLNNSTATTNIYQIIDMNHDNTNNTVDLMRKYTVKDNVTFGQNQYYNNASSPRVWLNGDYYNGFSTDIKNHMQTMAVAWNNTTLNDKVKLPSVTELAATIVKVEFSPIITEGNDYPLFKHVKNKGYWLRTFMNSAYSSNYNISTCICSSEGSVVYVYYYNNTSIVPIFRLA